MLTSKLVSGLRAAGLVVLLLLSACAAQPGKFVYFSTAETHVFPKPPDVPRYRFVGILAGEANFVTEQKKKLTAKKAFAWLVGLVAGKETPRRLERPQSGWTDPQTGTVYVADVARKAVLVFDIRQGFLHFWDSAAKHQGFVTPIAVTGGPENTLLVSDADLRKVIVLDKAGKPLREIGHESLIRPIGLVWDEDAGEIYVADAQAHDIKVFSHHGLLKRTLGKKGQQNGEFIGPTHLAWYQHRLYVTDTLNSRVQILDSEGKWLKTVGKRGMYIGELPRPKGVAVDNAGRLYIVESYHDYLLVYDAEGRFLLPIGGSGQEIGQFYLPAGVWVDNQRRVYVADTFNSRVMVFEYLGDPTNNKSS